MKDPTLEQMREFIDANPFKEEIDEFDREESIYWFACANHGGQHSNLYAALSQTTYCPGPITRGPKPGSLSQMLLEDLEAEFG